MKDDARPAAEPLVSGAEIARLAGVTRAAVSNWRRRYDDFPAPMGGGSSAPLFSLAEIRSWLLKRRKGQGLSDEVRLWQALRGAFGDEMVTGLASVARLLAEGVAPDLDAGLAEMAEGLATDESPAQVIDNLVDRFLDSSRRSSSDQVTSPRLVKAISHFAAPVPRGSVVYDPACGIGSLLLSVGPAKGGAVLRGQEVDPAAGDLVRLRAELAGMTDAVIEKGDSLREDRWPDLRADLVVCDPPVAVPDWGREELLLDSRWEVGIPSRAEGELAWLQHCYAHTAPGGRVLTVMPASVAYRKAGRRIRAELVRRGILTEVVALPAGMVAAHSLPVHLWALRRPEAAAEAATSVRMVDLTANDLDGPLEPRPEQVIDVPLIELLDDSVDVTPASYVPASRQGLPGQYTTLRRQIEERLNVLAALLPPLEPGESPGSLDGATVSLADLSRAGLVAHEETGPVSASEQLDTDYLRGFLASPSNNRRSTSTSGSFRLDTKGARVPQMAVDEQRRYGAAFRALKEFEAQIKEVARLSEQAAVLARDGLTNGALTPPADIG